MAEVASAYVSLMFSAKGAQSQIGNAISRDASQAGQVAGDKASRGFSSAFGSGLKSAAGVALKGAAVLGAIGVAAGGYGLKIAAANEQAQISFTTMLGSAQKAGVFLKQLQAFAAKTPFEFPELQTAASSLISAGINAKKVIPIMTTLGDVTSGMGTGAEGVQRATIALQQMNAAGKITGEDLNQLRDAGIPVYDLLSKATGKSKAQVVALAQAGKLGHKELGQMMKALETGKGLERFSGLMDKQSQSLSGLVSTFKDTLGQGLASAVKPAIPLIKDGLTAASNALAVVLPKVRDGIRGLVKQFRTGTGPGGKFAGFLQRVGDTIKNADIAGAMTGIGAAIGGIHWAGVGDGLGQIGDALGRIDWSAIKDGLGSGVSDTVSVFATVIGFAADHVGLLAKMLPALVVAFAAYKTAQAAANVAALAEMPIRAAQIVSNFALASAQRSLAAQLAILNGAEKVGLLTRIRSTVATVAHTTAMVASAVASKAVAAATKTWAAVQWVLNAALDANPIGLIVIAIAALVAGVIIAYKKFEWFRKGVQFVFSAISAYAKFMWNNVYQPIFKLLVKGIAWIMDKFGDMLEVMSHVPGFGWAKTAADLMHNAADKANNLADNISKIRDKTVTVTYNEVTIRSVQNKQAGDRRLIGHNALGTENWRGGLTWVGESGKELLDLPRGSKIIPNHRIDSAVPLAGAGPQTFRGVLSIDRDGVAYIDGRAQHIVRDGQAAQAVANRRASLDHVGRRR